MANETESGGASAFEPKTGDPWYGPMPPDPWYIAGGSVVDVDERFRADMEVPVGRLEVLFGERAAQPLPNDRVTWRSTFPNSVIPLAMFPCTDPKKPEGQDQIRDVVDGLVLTAVQNGALHRRLASGLYAPDVRGRFVQSPVRALELTSSEQRFRATDKYSLDPPGVATGAEGPFALSGIVVARLRGEGTLMQKRDDGENGWRLHVQEDGDVRLYYKASGDSARSITVSGPHLSGEWFAALFSIEYVDGSEPGVVLRLFTPHDSEEVAFSGAVPWPQPSAPPEETPDPVIDARFVLGGAVGQIAFAAYWHGNADRYQLATSNNFHRLWRGTVFPPNIAENPGLVLERSGVAGFRVGETLGNGDAVLKFAPTGAVVPQDPFEVRGGERALPHDRERTNLVHPSEDFSLWNDGPDRPSTTGPDGLLSAFEILSGTAIEQDVTTPAENYVFSVWARSTNGAAITLYLDGEESASTVLSRRWTRVSFSTACGGNPTAKIEATGPAGSTVAIWGAQVEAGTEPSAYLPTSASSPSTVDFTECYADFDVLPGPRADYGKVEAVLLAAPALVGEIGEEFAAFEVADNVGNYLCVRGEVTADDEKRFIVWKASGQLWDGEDPDGDCTVPEMEAEPIPLKPWTPLKVAIRWHSRGVELWVEDELVARVLPIPATPGDVVPVSFYPSPAPPVKSSPYRCDLMRRSSGSGLPWIGACKELRWWR